MLLPRELLSKVNFYTCQTYSQTTPQYSQIVLHLRKQWWQFWIKPVVIKFNCIKRTDGNYTISTPDAEYTELKNQLWKHMQTPTRSTAKLIGINGGKHD